MVQQTPPRTLSDLLRGNGVAFLGDSITAGNVDYASGSVGSGSWAVMACMASGQRIRFVRNAGISGNTTAQMLARMNADVIAYRPDVCFVLGGTNDIGQSVPAATIRATLATIYRRLRGAGIQPVACTVTPRSTTTGNQDVELLNAWIRAYCGRQGIWVVDLAAEMTDPATFGWLGGGTYNVDGLHPNAAGGRLMALRAIADVADLVPNAPPYLPLYADGGVAGPNMLRHGLFTNDGNGDGVADNWTATDMGAGITHSRATVSGVIGKVQRAVVTVAGLRYYQQNVDGSLWSVGDRLAFTGIFSTTGIEAGGMKVAASAQFTNGAAPGQVQPLVDFALDVTQWRFYAEAVIPTGTTAVSVRLLTTANGTGTVEWGQVALINLTRLGIED